MTASKSRGALHHLGLFKTSLHGSNLSLKHVHRQFPNQFQTKAYCGGEKIHNQSSTHAQTKREAMYKPKHIYTSVNSHNYRTSLFIYLPGGLDLWISPRQHTSGSSIQTNSPRARHLQCFIALAALPSLHLQGAKPPTCCWGLAFES